MKGLRWVLAFLRDPVGTLGSSIATIRACLAPLENRIHQTVTETLRKAARKLALGLLAAALALVGAGYVLIGLWLGFESLLGPIAASFLLGAWFLLMSLVPLAVLSRIDRKSHLSSDEAGYDLSTGRLE